MLTSQFDLRKRCYGAVDEENRLIIPFEYSELDIQFNGITAKSRNGNCSIFSNTGEKLYELPANFQMRNILILNNRDSLFSLQNSKCGLINSKGEIILEPIYEAIMFFCGVSYMASEYNYLCKYENLEESYFQVGAFLETKIPLKKDGLWGVVSYPSGKFLCNFEFINIVQCQYGYIKATKSNSETLSL